MFPPKILFTSFPPLNLGSTVTKQVQMDFMLLGCYGQQCQCHLPPSHISCFSPDFFSNIFPFSSFVLFLSIFLFRGEPVLMARTQADRHKSVLSHPAPPLSRAAGITGQEQPLERWQEDTHSKFLPGSLYGGWGTLFTGRVM